MTEPRLSTPERAVLEALRGLSFGSVEAVVHDGRIVRIERKEKLRLDYDPETGVPAADITTHLGTPPDRRSSPASERGTS